MDIIAKLYESGIMDSTDCTPELIQQLKHYLQIQGDMLLNIYDTMPCGILRFVRRKGAYELRFANNYAQRFFREAGCHILTQDWCSGFADITLPEDRSVLTNALASLRKPGDIVCTEYRVRCADGGIRYLTGNASMISIDVDEQVIQRFFFDITTERVNAQKLEARLALEKATLAGVRALTHESDSRVAMNLFLQNIGGYYKADRTYIFECNPDACTFSNTYEWCAAGVVPQLPRLQCLSASYFRGWIEQSREHKVVYIPDTSQAELGDQRTILEMQSIQHLLVTGIYRGEELIGFLGVGNPRQHVNDPTLLQTTADFVTEELLKHVLIHDLEDINFTDPLTRLGNRRKYTQVLLDYAHTPPRSMGVFFVDLNGLKSINETGGHDEGDYFIRQCAEIIRPFSPLTFRIDGDEFVILLPDIDELAFQHEEMRLRRELKQLPFGSASLGSAWEDTQINLPTMISAADEMMFAEKQVYYRSAAASSEHLRFRSGAASDILESIQSSRFEVFFQPIVDLYTGALHGAEALVRQRGSDGSLIPPLQFIPIYEAEGVISHLDLHVFEQVCKLQRQWFDSFGKLPVISVNFSRVTLMEEGIVLRLHDICQQYGVAPEAIVIEVTESTGKLSHEQLCNLVRELQAVGFAVSLDDFGSQYSNLSILTYMDFQHIKLDKSLIDRITIDSRNSNLVWSLICLCNDTLFTLTVAEGVETDAQVRMLQSFSCSYAQGYYFSRPVPADTFTQMLAEDHHFPLPDDMEDNESFPEE